MSNLQYLDIIRYMYANLTVFEISEAMYNMFKPGNEIIETPGMAILLLKDAK